MTLAVDKTPLPGKAKSKRGSKRKAAPASTPDAAAALAETPVAETLDFTFKNAWLARVTQGFSREDILDLAMSTMRPYADAKEAGVKLPTVPGGYESLSLEKFDGVVAMLESLADFGKWDHTSDKPDLPAEYPVAPSLSHACMALGCGLERIEIAYNAKLPGKSKKKVDLTAGLLKKLGGKFDSIDQFSQDVLSAMAQEGRIWQSDGGRVTPFRLEFYMRSKDITQSILTKVFDMATSPSWRDFYSECEGMDAQAKWIIANAVKKASEATAAAVERRLKAEQARKAKAAAAAKAASGAGAGYADAASLAARSAAAGAEDMDAEDDASDSNRSALSAAESARSHLTDMSVRSVLSAVGSVRSTRSVLTDVSDAMRKDGSIRASVDKVKMHDALDLQKTQFGRPGLTMSLTEANAAAECDHRRWVFDDNLVIDIRNGSMVWLTPIDSTFENGSPWWTCSQLGNPGAPHEQWNALQMVWGMEAFRKENEGTLVRPEDVEKRVRSELAKLDGGTKADGGEDLSGKTFTPTQKSLFRKLNELAQAGIDDGASGFMKHIGFDKLDSGEAVTLIRTLGYMTESQFKQVLPTLELLLERYLSSYNPVRGGLAVMPFQAVVVLYCEWSRMVPTRNGRVPVCTMATFTAEREQDQLVPTPLAGESSSATKQTMSLEDGELIVQGPQGATRITRPPITEAVQVWVALANIKAMLYDVHPVAFATQTLLSVDFMCTRAVTRDTKGGIFETSLILAQCFLWLGDSVARHLRLVGSVEGFSFALTPSQSQTIESQRSRNEVQTLQTQLRQMQAAVDQRLSNLANTFKTEGSPQGTPGGRKSRGNRGKHNEWEAPGGAPAPAPAPAPSPSPAPVKQQKVTFVNTDGAGSKEGKGGRGKGGKGKGKGKGGKGRGYVSRETNEAMVKVYGRGTDFFDARAEWISQWPDQAERKGHCFLIEKLGIDCDSRGCPKCNPRG